MPDPVRGPLPARDDEHSIGWIQDRLVLLVPAHAVALVARASDQLDDLAPSCRLPVKAPRFDPVTYVCVARSRLAGHALTSIVI
jgi:hypothetical protein